MPGVVDAWYTLLDRWGTMTFAQVLQPAIEMAEDGFPIGERMAGAIAGSRKLKKYPTSVKVYFPGGDAPEAGRHLQESRIWGARCGSWSRPRRRTPAKAGTRR